MHAPVSPSYAAVDDRFGSRADVEALTPDARLQWLEKFRYQMLGMINAQNVIIADLVCDKIFSEDYPLPAIEALKKNWLVRGKLAATLHARVDPAEADLIEEEFRDAIDLLAITIADRIRLHKPLARM